MKRSRTYISWKQLRGLHVLRPGHMDSVRYGREEGGVSPWGSENQEKVLNLGYDSGPWSKQWDPGQVLGSSQLATCLGVTREIKVFISLPKEVTPIVRS